MGHRKNNGHLGRNFLKGEVKDAINALLWGAGYNLHKILRQLAFFCALRFGDCYGT
jgi:IS5 family transposase